MDRLFRIDFYPSEWIIQTGAMTPVQRGIFIQIVSMIYANRGPIVNDASYIGRASNCSTRLARSVVQQLIDMDSIQVEGLRITQRRCERELNMKRSHLENSAKGGRTSNQKEPKDRRNNGMGPSEQEYPLPTPRATASPIALQEQARQQAEDKNDAGKEVLTETRDEILPSEWHDLAEKRGIPDEQIYRSWKRFKELSEFPFRLDRWGSWIDRERIQS